MGVDVIEFTRKLDSICLSLSLALCQTTQCKSILMTLHVTLHLPEKSNL